MFLSVTCNHANLLFFPHRNDFSGTMSAYGAGNDDTLSTYKAGPGTIYIAEGNKQYLTISGDTDSSIQNQTKTDITGGIGEFVYDQLTLNGNALFTYVSQIQAESPCSEKFFCRVLIRKKSFQKYLNCFISYSSRLQFQTMWIQLRISCPFQC